MDFDLPPEDDPRRLVVRLARRQPPSDRAPAAVAGYVVPQWSPPWGLGADPVHRLIIDDELDRAGARPPRRHRHRLGGLDALVAGTPEQQQRFLPGILSGEDQWCQLFSEPDGVGPGRPHHLGRARRRRVCRHRCEDLVERRPPCAATDLARPHRLGRACRYGSRPRFALLPGRAGLAAAPGHLLLRLPDGPAGHHAAADRRHDHGALVQPGVLRPGVRLPLPLRAGEEGAGGGSPR